MNGRDALEGRQSYAQLGSSWPAQDRVSQQLIWHTNDSSAGQPGYPQTDVWAGQYHKSYGTPQLPNSLEAPPLPPEHGEPPPLPPEEELPPLPPPEDGSGGLGSTRTNGTLPPPHPQAEFQSGPAANAGGVWQTYQPHTPGQSVYGPTSSAQPHPPEGPGSNAPPFHGSREQYQAQASTSYSQWDSNWTYPGYSAYQQTGAAAAYSSYQGGYQDSNGAYTGYTSYPYDPQQACFSSAPPPWGGQLQPSGHEASWNQPGIPQALQAAADSTLAPAVVNNEVDAEEVFLKPGRDKRPRKIAVIMRGLPGSGKSHIAKKLRDIEVEHGSEAPRIHALDDYFVTEVEKEEVEQEAGKKPRKKTVTVMDYLYEPELEDSYKQSVLKAFTKTVEEGRFSFVIFDAPNILVEDFRPFYLAAQRTGYQVFVLKPLEMDPEVCFRRNVHQRDRDSLSDLAALYEPTPKLYTQLLVESLFDMPKPPKDEENAIEEVDMEDDGVDTESDQPKVKSRWAELEDEEPAAEEEHPKTKRRRKEAATTQGSTSSGAANSGKVTRGNAAPSILRKPGTAPPDKSLRWADRVVPAEGFTIGGAAQELAVVYYVEGLGPAKDEGEESHSGAQHQGSFQDQAREDRKSEGQSFRDILFGGRRP